jgi:hypothetical protein
MAGIVTIAVETFNGQLINDNKGFTATELVRARTLKDGKVFLNVSNDGSLNMNEYILDSGETLNGLFTKVTDKADGFLLVPIFREETGGGSQDFSPATNFILNTRFVLDMSNTKDVDGIVTGTVIQYRNNYNDYFAILYTTENLLETASGNGEAVGV